MLDLLLILIPAVLIILGIGWWIIKDMTPRARYIGKLLVSLVMIAVAGIIVLAFFGGVGVMVVAFTVIGYKLYNQRQ